MIAISSKLELIYRFMSVKGIGIVQTNKFIISIQKYESILEMENQAKSILNNNQIYEFETNDHVIKNVNSKYPVEFISLLDENYPKNLKDFSRSNTPPVLSYIGNLQLLTKKKVAFSGSRKVSEKGISLTEDLVQQLAEKEVTIVSGYAKGVDMKSHHTALESGGTTIIILPEGINYFRIKRELKEVWDWDRVLVISEFKPTDRWMASRAMLRNNTIVGISDVIVVVEAGETGGSLDAGEKTIQFGKHLFVPKYGIVPDSARGNNQLINKGAFPIKMNKDTLKANLSKMFEFLNTSNNHLLF